MTMQFHYFCSTVSTILPDFFSQFTQKNLVLLPCDNPLKNAFWALPPTVAGAWAAAAKILKKMTFVQEKHSWFVIKKCVYTDRQCRGRGMKKTRLTGCSKYTNLWFTEMCHNNIISCKSLFIVLRAALCLQDGGAGMLWRLIFNLHYFYSMDDDVVSIKVIASPIKEKASIKAHLLTFHDKKRLCSVWIRGCFAHWPEDSN